MYAIRSYYEGRLQGAHRVVIRGHRHEMNVVGLAEALELVQAVGSYNFV